MEFMDKDTGKTIIGTIQLPGEEKPILYVREDDTIIKLAEFRNQQSMEFFERKFKRLIGAEEL